MDEFAFCLSDGRKHRRNRAPLQLRFAVEHADVRNSFDEALNGFKTEFRVFEFANAEHERYFHLVPVEKEHFRAADLDHKVMLVNTRTHFNFFKFSRGLLLLFLLFRFFVKVFSVVNDTANRRLGIRRDFEQIKVVCLREGNRGLRSHDSELFAARPDDANFGNSNALIAARPHIPAVIISIIRSAVLTRTGGIIVSAELLRCCHSVIYFMKKI